MACMYHIKEVDSSDHKTKPVLVSVSVDGVQVKMQVDTGASSSVIARDMLVSLYGKAKLLKLGGRPDLCAYGGFH